MELSLDTVNAIIERLSNEGTVTDYAGEYGEPGYHFDHPGPTQRFLIGDWWCRCGQAYKVLRPGAYGQFGPPSPNELHQVSAHHPRLWEQLYRQGVEVAFYDEWCVDYENDKAYRTTADSYSWQPSALYDDDGELMTPDTDIEVWVAWAVNDPRRCLFSWHVGDLKEVGFEQCNGLFESGWYPGQNDDPVAILDAWRSRDDDAGAEYVFALDYNAQFAAGFNLFRRGEPQVWPTTEEDDDDVADDS